MDEKKIEKLYELLEVVEASGDKETTAALRWAIVRLENPAGNLIFDRRHI